MDYCVGTTLASIHKDFDELPFEQSVWLCGHDSTWLCEHNSTWLCVHNSAWHGCVGDAVARLRVREVETVTH